ncbi:MAG TPA: diaminopimelate epimerase [Marinobacter sp.]|nr:diaminopimelate epimerase [Marinobacter sp.]
MTESQDINQQRRGPVPLFRFTKMHGLGNDFIVVDAISQPFHLRPETIRELAHRNFGIGFNQLLVVEPPGLPDADFRYRIFNADGSEVEQCVNGARCFARFVRDQKLTNKRALRVQTASGVLELRVGKDGMVMVNMGVPELNPQAIPFIADQQQIIYPIAAGDENLELSVVAIGSPYGVLIVDDIDTAPLVTLGARFENHPRFPSQVNIACLQVVDRTHARLRVYKHGAGELPGCGSGACAAMVAGYLRGLLGKRVELELKGGRLIIEWRGEGTAVMMEGPAASVFEGQLRLPGGNTGRRRKTGRPSRQRS